MTRKMAPARLRPVGGNQLAEVSGGDSGGDVVVDGVGDQVGDGDDGAGVDEHEGEGDEGHAQVRPDIGEEALHDLVVINSPHLVVIHAAVHVAMPAAATAVVHYSAPPAGDGAARLHPAGLWRGLVAVGLHGLLRAELELIDALVGSGAAYEPLVGAALYDFALVHDQDEVGVLEGTEAVGDDEGGAALDDLLHGLVDPVLGLRVHAGGGVVQDEDGWVQHQSPGDGEALALPTGEGQSALADPGVVAVGHFHDLVVELGDFWQLRRSALRWR